MNAMTSWGMGRTDSYLTPETDGELLTPWTTGTDFDGSHSGTSSNPFSRVTTTDSAFERSTASGQQRFVLADPVAFRYYS